MDPFNGIVKEEELDYFAGDGYSTPSSWAWPGVGALAELPRPMEGLGEAGSAPFLNKTYQVVDDHSTDTVVSWGVAGNSFVVWDAHAFSVLLLPRYFKHGNFSSFVRQLNTYGFRKVDPDRWEFAAEGFLRGHKELLKTIRRRRTQSSTSPSHSHQAARACLDLDLEEVGREGEVHRLQRDKGILIAEVVKLRQEQQAARALMQAMEARIAGTEQRQQQMKVYLARALKCPQILVGRQDRSRRRELQDTTLSKKRGRPPIDYAGPANGETSRSASYSPAAVAREYGVGLDDGAVGEDTESFWMELLSLGLEEKQREAGGGGEPGVSEVDVLLQGLYHLSPNRPHNPE